jgi:hypothetical protein
MEAIRYRPATTVPGANCTSFVRRRAGVGTSESTTAVFSLSLLIERSGEGALAAEGCAERPDSEGD